MARGRAGAQWLSHPLPLVHAVSHIGALPLIFIVGVILRLLPLCAGYPLHHDEALYGFWARMVMSGRDPLLLTAWVDKPPLVLYALAGSLRFLGISDLALRLPGVVVSLATLVCTHGLASRVYGRRTALLAAALLAASPFAILFAPTAFTDPWLTLWLVAAAWAALAGRSFLAGIALGLAVASKQQGLLGVPLIMALLLIASCSTSPANASRPPSSAFFGRFLISLLGFAMIFAPVTYWDSLRWATRPSFWDRSLTTYGGLVLAAPTLWLERAAGWAEQTRYLFGLPVLTLLMLSLALVAGVRDRRTCKQAGGAQGQGGDEARLASRLPPSTLILVYLAGYATLHFFVTFQPWDRYLLPLLPFICVLAARGILITWRWGGEAALGLPWLPTNAARLVRSAMTAVLIAFLALSSWLGVTARLPVGSDHGAYFGLDRISAFLAAQPADAVIYDRWIGWHFDFYLFDAPQERRWWGSGWKLADDAAAIQRDAPDRVQWLVLPGWRDAAASEVRLALASRRLALAEMERIYRPGGSRAFTVYRIVPVERTDGG
ncbi:MAG: glycosyltransferase family 39 protein [Anaerolineae bacterium]|nr:glycosyltransferase family 39 protein [Anaerolineae bacterium]